MAVDLLFRDLLERAFCGTIARTIMSRVDARLAGAEHLPSSGGYLLVGNHALLGLDSMPFTVLLVQHTGRMPYFLGDRHLWRIPVMRTLLSAIGAIPGERDAAVNVLREGHPVIVYPGGVDDSFKHASEAYRLQWGNRCGFVHAAMRGGVPIVPFVGEGIDDLFEVVAREPWIGRRLLGSSRYDLPIARGAFGLPVAVPRLVPLVYHVLPPVDTAGDPDRPEDVQRVRQATLERMESVLRVVRALRERKREQDQAQ